MYAYPCWQVPVTWHTRMHADIVCICMCVRVYIYVHIHTYIHTYTYIIEHTRTRASKHIGRSQRASTRLVAVYVWVCVCVVYMHIYIYAYIYIYTHIYHNIHKHIWAGARRQVHVVAVSNRIDIWRCGRDSHQLHVQNRGYIWHTRPRGGHLRLLLWLVLLGRVSSRACIMVSVYFITRYKFMNRTRKTWRKIQVLASYI